MHNKHPVHMSCMGHPARPCWQRQRTLRCQHDGTITSLREYVKYSKGCCNVWYPSKTNHQITPRHVSLLFWFCTEHGSDVVHKIAKRFDHQSGSCGRDCAMFELSNKFRSCSLYCYRLSFRVHGKYWLYLVFDNVFNTFRPRQNGRHFAYDIFKCIFLDENVWSLSLRFELRIFQH